MLRFFLFAREDQCFEVLGGNQVLELYIGSYASLEEAKAASEDEKNDIGKFGPRQIIGLTADFQLKLVSQEVENGPPEGEEDQGYKYRGCHWQDVCDDPEE